MRLRWGMGAFAASTLIAFAAGYCLVQGTNFTPQSVEQRGLALVEDPALEAYLDAMIFPFAQEPDPPEVALPFEEYYERELIRMMIEHGMFIEEP